MLEIQLDIAGRDSDARLFGEVWNITQLAATSDYDFFFQGRKKPTRVVLTGYPRWCEPVSGLFARCLNLTCLAHPDGHLGPWTFLRLRLGIRPGGVRDYRPLAQVRVKVRDHELAIAATEGTLRSAHQVSARDSYDDAWDVAAHVLRIAAFGRDELRDTRPLDIPIHTDGRLNYVCMRDIPEPARSAFEERMSGSGCPAIPGCSDAVYAWDWTDFLNGRR